MENKNKSIYEVDDDEFRKRIVNYVKGLKLDIDNVKHNLDLETKVTNLESLEGRVDDLEEKLRIHFE